MDGLALKIERIRHRLPQYEVAAALRIHPSILCGIENGRRAVSADLADAIVKAIRDLAAQDGAEDGDGRAA